MTNLTRLRLILVDLSGLIKKKHYKSLSLYILPIWILVSRYANTREQHALPIFTAVSYKKICKNKWVDKTTAWEARCLAVTRKKVARFYLNKIRPRHKQPPRIYGLPQIHNANIPLRPIVSCVNTFAYGLSAFLANILSPLQATQISRWLTQLTSHTSSAVRRFKTTRSWCPST